MPAATVSRRTGACVLPSQVHVYCRLTCMCTAVSRACVLSSQKHGTHEVGVFGVWILLNGFLQRNVTGASVEHEVL